MMKWIILDLVLCVSLASGMVIPFNRLNDENEFLEFKTQAGVVTGGSAGIGYATVLEFARKGAEIVFCARDSHPSWYNGTYAQIKINSDPIVIKNQGSATFFRADISNPKDVRAFISFAYKKMGRIDFAANVAGIGGYQVRVDLIEDDWLHGIHDPIRNNLYGTFFLMREEIKHFREHGDKDKVYSIVNFSSVNGKRACENCSLYSASKHGIIGLTKSAALENVKSSPRIRVNGVAPGMTDTPLTWNQVKLQEYGMQDWEGEYIDPSHPLWEKWGFVYESTCPAGRMATPLEMAQIALFLSSQEATYVSGAVYDGDLGYMAQ
jgi:NAD(P)-dependent dehydrogenase (short-subunit alcohol dehydrogenase family)